MTRQNKFKKAKVGGANFSPIKTPSLTALPHPSEKRQKRTISQVSQPQADPTVTSRPRLSSPTAKPGDHHVPGTGASAQKIASTASDAPHTVPTPLSLPSDLQSLESSHNLISLNIISSTTIRQKVVQIQKHLNNAETAKPALVAIRGKAHVASKVISVVEIAKRQFQKRKVYQYSGISSVIDELKMNDSEKKELVSADGNPVDGTNGAGPGPRKGEDGDVDDDDTFETMPDPQIRANLDPKRKKIRAIPVLTVYLSLAPVLKLKQAFGEQTT